VRSPLAYKQIPVRGSANFLSRIELPTPCITDLVQQGLSEKVPLMVGFFSAFVTGFVLAYIRNWRRALAMSSIIPCICISGGLMNFAPLQKKSCLQSVPLRLLAPRECLRLCVMLPPRMPTLQIVEAHWFKRWACPFFFAMYAAYALGEFCALLFPRTYSSDVHIPSVQLWDHAHHCHQRGPCYSRRDYERLYVSYYWFPSCKVRARFYFSFFSIHLYD
jgi:hypothetical protein